MLRNPAMRIFGFLEIVGLILIAGCTLVEIPAQKQFDCSGGRETWHCRSRATGKCIKNTYVDPEYCEDINGTNGNGTNNSNN